MLTKSNPLKQNQNEFLMQKKNLSCTICNSSTRLETKYEFWDVFRCTYCSHAFSANITKSIENIYDENYFEKNWFLYPNFKLFKTIDKTIRREFGPEARIHDLGCGNGNLLQYLYQKGYRNLYGSDIVSCLIPNLEELINFQQTDALKIKDKEAYDVVISIANIEHLSDINSYMVKLREILVPEGLAIIYTINESALIYTIAKIMRKFGIGFAAKQLFDPHHINHLNKRSLTQLAKKHGFEIISLQTLNYPLKSTDVFLQSPLMRILVLTGIFFTNLASSLLKSEISQLLFIRPKP